MTGAVILALLPVILLIGLGAWLRRSGFLAAGFWPQAERLCYFVLLPALFVHGLSTAPLHALPVGVMAVTLIGAILVVAGLVLAAHRLRPIDGPAFTSVFQGSIRFNNYAAVTVAAGLFGAQGIALAALCNAAMVPTVNVLCILVFARYGQARLDLGGVLRQIATNPLILGCAGGMLLQFGGLALPPGLDQALRALGAASLPLGLLCVGAALDFGSVRSWVRPVAGSAAVRFLVMPGVTLAIGSALGLGGEALVVALLVQAMPTASSAYILARQLGGDAPLMAGITASQTALAALAVPAVLTVLAP
ncbi:putative transmembrane protein [Rhodovastum atsumiense]|uniref:AEC family transporter n=1 Tax=Rhodovastum atsumiense TaxID=504468 RepID=A0A5M6IMK2_9PROT|nr:AEC family transporter [Rhodovastum atsumiense]KAA5608785.1 AEC family transporter [Rhodovastum atsumiense]CAH2602862.1 putative transmembrane protein [Rhodovastum atsumiense]